jgi:hypothetical protein
VSSPVRRSNPKKKMINDQASIVVTGATGNRLVRVLEKSAQVDRYGGGFLISALEVAANKSLERPVRCDTIPDKAGKGGLRSA